MYFSGECSQALRLVSPQATQRRGCEDGRRRSGRPRSTGEHIPTEKPKGRLHEGHGSLSLGICALARRRPGLFRAYFSEVERGYGFLIFGALCAAYFVELYLLMPLGMSCPLAIPARRKNEILASERMQDKKNMNAKLLGCRVKP